MKKNKRNTFIYYPANVAKIKEIFETKLKEYGLLNEFYNAKDKDELRLIASYLSALRLNKQYLKDDKKIDEKKDCTAPGSNCGVRNLGISRVLKHGIKG